MNLYMIDQSIKNAIDSLYDRVDENGELIEMSEEDIKENLKKLEEFQGERQTKIENTVLYCKNLDSEAAAIKAEEESLRKRRERIESKSERLKRMVMFSMMANNENEFESTRCYAKLKETDATDIIDMDLIPEEYIKVTTPEPERKPDKNAIKKAIKAGQDIPGAQLIKNRKLNIE